MEMRAGFQIKIGVKSRVLLLFAQETIETREGHYVAKAILCRTAAS